MGNLCIYLYKKSVDSIKTCKLQKKFKSMPEGKKNPLTKIFEFKSLTFILLLSNRQIFWFERTYDDLNSAGKVVLLKVVKERYYQKMNVPDPNLELGYLESRKYWLNYDSSKYSNNSFEY